VLSVEREEGRGEKGEREERERREEIEETFPPTCRLFTIPIIRVSTL